MPNAIIAVGMAIIIGSVHLYRRHPEEMEDQVAVDGTTQDDVGDKEEDAVGDSRVPKEYQRMLLRPHWDQKGLYLNYNRCKFDP